MLNHGNHFRVQGTPTGDPTAVYRIKDSAGQRLYYPIDNYLEERSMWIEYRGIRIVNHHRPMSAYMRPLIDAGLRLAYFDEPAPGADAPTLKAANYRRAPWFLVMEWVKPA